MKILNEIPPKVGKDELVAMDVETFGQEKAKLHRPTGTFACLSVCIDGKNVYQIYDAERIGDVFGSVSAGTWVFHNALYDLRQLRRYHRIAPRYIHDTMLVDQSMYGGYYQNFGLRDLTRRWLGERLDKEARDEFEDTDHMTVKMKQYAARDALVTWKIATLQKKEFEDDPAFRAYTMIDEPMIFPLLDMPGVPVDRDGWKVMVTSFAEQAGKLEEELGVNSFSGLQVMKAAGQHGIHIRDTRAETLKAYKDNQFIAKVIKARMYRKAVSTYGESWLEKNIEADGLVYSSYHITGAETGRMSSSSPNMQQIPARVLPEYRKLFPTLPGHVMLVSDISQQEPRILAHESKDMALIKAFESGEDLHLYVARAIFGEPKMKKTDPRRFIGKTINLGTSYGLSEYGLATRLNITEQEAARFLRLYFGRFTGVFAWIGNKRMEANANGYVTTASGRKVYMNPYDKGWMNNAINAPIQGGAADFTKMWVRKIWEGCRSARLPFMVDRIVHDEIVQNVPKEQAKIYEKILNVAFQETAKKLFDPIPFVVDTEKGKSWACKQMLSELEVEDAEE